MTFLTRVTADPHQPRTPETAPLPRAQAGVFVRHRTGTPQYRAGGQCGRVQDLPSFLQEVTTVRGQIAYANVSLRAARSAPPSLAVLDDIELSQLDLLVPLSEMAGAAGAVAPVVVSSAGKPGSPGGGALVPTAERYALASLAMLRLVLARQAKLFVRDVTLVRARIGQCVVMGLLIGGLWFQRDNTLDDARCGTFPAPSRMSPP